MDPQSGGGRVGSSVGGKKKLGYEGSSRACECKGDQRFVSYRRRRIATLLGSVNLHGAYYHCDDCGTGASPYSRRAGLGSGCASESLARAALMLAVGHSYEEASRILNELTGQHLSGETIRRLAVRLGQKVSDAETGLAGQMEQWDPPAAKSHPERLFTATDGVMVGMRDGFHEVKLAVCYGEEKDGQECRRYVARLEAAEKFRAYAWSTACQSGLEGAKEKVLLGDGAAWIWDQVGGVLGEDVVHIVDWYHAMEHVWSCGRVLHGEKTPQTLAWVKTLENLLWEGEVRQILARLEEEQGRMAEGVQREAIASLMTYIRNQDARLAYDRFRSARMRSVHGVSYTRLFDADLLSMVREFATDFQPPQEAGFVPGGQRIVNDTAPPATAEDDDDAPPWETNESSASGGENLPGDATARPRGGSGLYRGEQDMFCFLIDPTGWTEIDGEAFAPGFFLWISEVGRRSVGIQTFWFQAVCQNHIVWDAVEVVEFSRKHTANVHEAFSEIRRIVEGLVAKRDERRDGFVRVIRKAMETTVGDDTDTVLKVLSERGITRALAKEALKSAQRSGRFTVFSLVDALTRLNGRMKHAGERTDADVKASSLLAMAV